MVKIIFLNKYKLIITFIFSAIFLFVFPSSIKAATYYIDATNGLDSNTGLSSDNAWQSLSKASGSSVSSGDTILLKRGETWTGQTLTPKSGTYIDAYGSGTKPTIDGNSAVTRSISITASNVSVSNVIVKGATSNIVFSNASGTILNDIDSVGAPIAFRINAGTATLNRCTSSNATSASFFFDGGTSTVNNSISSTVTGSVGSGNGFRLSSSAVVTCNNCTAVGSQEDGFSISNTTTLTCNKCLSYNNGSTSSASSGDGYTSHDTSTLNIHSSIGYGNYKAGVAVTGASSGEILNSSFYNNVESTTGTGWDNGGDVGIGINATGTWVVKNNITEGHPVEFQITAAAISGGANITSDYNDFYDSLGGTAFDYNNTFYNLSGFKTASGTDSHSIHLNPLFSDISNNIFTLQSASPAINAGTDVGLTTDFAGNIVPYDSIPDMGAYEWYPPYIKPSPNILNPTYVCQNITPAIDSDLFQIDASTDFVKLYFTTVQHDVTGYAISYGTKPSADEWATIINYTGPLWIMSSNINYLNPNTTYYFKIRPLNGCVGGKWSKIISVRTKSVLISQPLIQGISTKNTETPTPTNNVRPTPSSSPKSSSHKHCFLFICW